MPADDIRTPPVAAMDRAHALSGARGLSFGMNLDSPGARDYIPGTLLALTYFEC
jgi:hypothetical protein